MHRWQVRLFLAFSLIWLAPTLACGSFAPRPTPTPTPIVPIAPPDTPTAPGAAETQPTPTPTVVEPPTVAPVETPTPAAAPPAQAGTTLATGQPARVTAPNGLNMRDIPSASGTLLIQLATGQRVTVVEGPTQAENYTWWRVDDGAGRVGWVADGDGETVWLNAQVGGAQPVNRAPRVGERVVVTMPANGQLSIRSTPGIQASLVTRVNTGTQYTVLAGPQQSNGYTWFQIRSDDGAVEGWAADGEAGVRWLSPLE